MNNNNKNEIGIEKTLADKLISINNEKSKLFYIELLKTARRKMKASIEYKDRLSFERICLEKEYLETKEQELLNYCKSLQEVGLFTIKKKKAFNTSKNISDMKTSEYKPIIHFNGNVVGFKEVIEIEYFDFSDEVVKQEKQFIRDKLANKQSKVEIIKITY